jgi:hypothetical protein
MDVKLVFGLLSSIIAIVSFLPYIRDILRKKTEPHIYSWLIWTILQFIAITAQLKDGAGYGSWSLIASMLLCFLIFVLGLKNGKKHITKFDTFCLILSLLTILVYLKINNSVVAIIMAVFINFIGFLPTLRKAYKNPQTETVVTYELGAIDNVLSLLALQNYTLVTTLYLINLLFTNTLLVLVVNFRKRISGCG